MLTNKYFLYLLAGCSRTGVLEVTTCLGLTWLMMVDTLEAGDEARDTCPPRLTTRGTVAFSGCIMAS